MSIPAQGAVGAETMTIAAIIEERWTGLIGPAMEGGKIGWKRHELCREFANAVRTALTHPIAVGKLPLVALDFAEAAWGDVWVENEIDTLREFAALASPRADSDERTAVEDGDLSAAIDVIDGCLKLAYDNSLNTMHVSGSPRHWKAVLAKLREATPAQPAGAVPGSLRFGEGKLVVDVGTYGERPSVFIKPVEVAGPIGELAADQGDLTRLEPGEQVLTFPTMEQARAVRDALLASHPAGQSAGSGAETPDVVLDGLDVLVTEMRARPGTGGGNRPDPMTAGYVSDLLHRAANVITRFVDAQDLPAPYSTRTGQGEASVWVKAPLDDNTLDHADSRLPLAMIEAGHDAYVRVQDDLKNYVAGETPDWDASMAAVAVYRAMIAARPAAPEAQGLERVRHVKRGTEYEVLHRGVPLQIAVGTGYSPTGNCLHEDDRLVIYRGSDGKIWAREERGFEDGRFEPAPPASSGQGGR